MLEVTGTKDLALGKGDVPKVMTGGTALETFEALKLTVIQECPILHTTHASTSALAGQRLGRSLRVRDAIAHRYVPSLYLAQQVRPPQAVF